MPTPDRRTVLAGSSSAPLAPASCSSSDAAGDKATETCLRYVALSDRYQTLSDEWAVLESWLCRKHAGFVGMSDADQALIPQTARFAEIDRERDEASGQAEALLPKVLKARFRTPEAMVARLMVIERLVDPEENDEANKLIRASLSDLGRYFSVPTWIWTTPWPSVPGTKISTYEPV